MFMENLPKKGPFSREFWAQNPTHMGGTYPYPQHIMYPPPGGAARADLSRPIHDVGLFDGYRFCDVILAQVTGKN